MLLWLLLSYNFCCDYGCGHVVIVTVAVVTIVGIVAAILVMSLLLHLQWHLHCHYHDHGCSQGSTASCKHHTFPHWGSCWPGVELAGMAKGPMTAKPKALQPRAEAELEHWPEMPVVRAWQRACAACLAATKGPNRGHVAASLLQCCCWLITHLPRDPYAWSWWSSFLCGWDSLRCLGFLWGRWQVVPKVGNTSWPKICQIEV